MSQIKLFLFGPPRIEQHGRNLEISLRKALALIAYLAVTKQPHTRDRLATLFWPELGAREARANLRRTLYRIHESLQQEILLVTPETVALDPQLDLWTDVDHFQQMLAQTLPPNRPAEDLPPETLASLSETANLYTADFMAGFTLPDSHDYDEWQFFQREGLRQLFAHLLQQLVAVQQASGDFDQAMAYTRRWLALDPLHEPAHRQLMQLYALSGQQAAALRQYQECMRILDAELGVLPEAETTALFETIKAKRLARHDRETSDKVTANHPLLLSSPRHNLPPQSTPFVGRATELTALLGYLADPTCRLLTLIGPGGMGKTRLALAAAQALLMANLGDDDTARTPLPAALRFSEGIYFVSLVAVNDRPGMAAAIADAVNCSFYSDVAPEQQLLAFLQTRQMLLILDNFEHLLPAADFVSALLVAAPALKIIVTARGGLNLHEAWFLPLAGLAFPTRGTSVQDAGATWDAIQFFVQCARRVRLDFNLSAVQSEVVEICQLVGGMPLALELAAAWLKVLSPERIVAELKGGLDLLTTAQRNMPERHRSMRLVLEQSWRLLSAAEQGVLRRLAVFRGGFSQEAASAVAGATLLDLAQLVEKALLQVTLNGTGSGRYQIHELLRQYGEEQLAQAPAELYETQAAHSRHFLAFLHAHQAGVRGGRQLAICNEIAIDYDNIRLAWQWAVDHAQSADLLNAVNVFYSYYEYQSKYLEGATILEATLPQLAAWEPTRTTELLRAEMLTVLGWLSNRLGRLARAKAVLQEAQALIEQLNRPPSISSAPDPRAALGVNALVQGDYVSAMAYAEGVRQTSEAHHHPWDQRLANYVLAGATLALGDYAAAQRYAETAFAIAQTVGDRWFMAYCLIELGDIAQALGDDGRAQRHYQTSYQLRQEFADPEGMALALSHLGGLALQRQEYTQAQQYYQESLHLYRDVNDKGGLARVLHGLGRLACAQQQWSAAQQYLWQALALAAEIHFSSLLLMILVTIADYLIQNHQPGRGLALLHFTQRHPTSPQATRAQAQQLLDQYQRDASASFAPAAATFPDDLEGVVASLLAQ